MRENRSIEKSQNELISYQLYCQRIFRNELWVWVNICVCNKHYYVDVRVYHATYIHKNAVFHLMHGEHQHKTTQQINWIPINFILLVLSPLLRSLLLPLPPSFVSHIFEAHIFAERYRVRNILHLGLLSNIAHIRVCLISTAFYYMPI